MLKQVSQPRATNVTAYAILLLSILTDNLKGHSYDILDSYIFLKIYLVLLYAASVRPAPHVPTEARRGLQMPWNWCHRLLWAALWVLGRKPRSSGETKDQSPWKADKQGGGLWLGNKGGEFPKRLTSSSPWGPNTKYWQLKTRASWAFFFFSHQ